MLHRAIFGSYERFIGILIEHSAGKLPLWLAPVQAVVATIVSDADDYAGKVPEAFKAGGIRVETDLRNEKINYKVREPSLAKGFGRAPGSTPVTTAQLVCRLRLAHNYEHQIQT